MKTQQGTPSHSEGPFAAGELEFFIDDSSLKVQGDGKKIRICASDRKVLKSMVSWLSLAPSPPTSDSVPDASPPLFKISQQLSRAGTTLDLLLEDRLIARLGHDARPGKMSKLLRVYPLEVKMSGIWTFLRSLRQERKDEHRGVVSRNAGEQEEESRNRFRNWFDRALGKSRKEDPPSGRTAAEPEATPSPERDQSQEEGGRRKISRIIDRVDEVEKTVDRLGGEAPGDEPSLKTCRAVKSPAD